MDEPEVVGMVQEANAPGNAGDMPTWTTMDGLKSCTKERQHVMNTAELPVYEWRPALAQDPTAGLQAPEADLQSLSSWRRQDGPQTRTLAYEVLGSQVSRSQASLAGQCRQEDRWN